MDDSNFFELQYKPRNNKIYALHFTYDNIDKLFQCLYRFMIDAKFILCADATIQLHMFDTKNSQINNRTCIGDFYRIVSLLKHAKVTTSFLQIIHGLLLKRKILTMNMLLQKI